MQDSASNRFKKRLRELREKRGWTQERAAEACGIGYKLFQLYELGIKNNPGLLTLEKISRGFGMDVSELLSLNLPKRRASAVPRRKARAKRAK